MPPNAVGVGTPGPASGVVAWLVLRRSMLDNRRAVGASLRK